METNKKAVQSTAKANTNVATQAATKVGFLASLTYATIETTKRSTLPKAFVRQNGQIVFSVPAAQLLGWDATKPSFFKAGTDKAGNIYLVPATAETPNVIKATKNNDSMQFRQNGTLTTLGAQYKDVYSVEAGKDGDVVYYKLTKLPKVAKAETETAPATPVKS